MRPHGTAPHYNLGVKWDRNSMGPLTAFMDNLTAFVDNLSACGPILHLAIVGVGRKKSHFMGPLAAFMDNPAALMDNQVCRPTTAADVHFFKKEDLFYVEKVSDCVCKQRMQHYNPIIQAFDIPVVVVVPSTYVFIDCSTPVPIEKEKATQTIWKNNTSGIPGVHYIKSRKQWIARWVDKDKRRQIRTFPVKKCGGYSSALEAAVAARNEGIAQAKWIKAKEHCFPF